MKRYIYTILAALTLLAAMSTFHSCTKPEVSVTLSDKTAKEETLLRYAAQHYELIHYESERTAWVFFFDTDNVTYSEISVPVSLVRGVEDNESYCKVQFASGNSASLKYVSEVALTLAPVTAVKGYPGEYSRVDFEVKKEGRGNVNVSSSDAVVSFVSSTGKGYATVLVPENEGETAEYSITISDGHNRSEYAIHASAYFFKVETTSVTIGADAGDKTELSLQIATDLEDYSYTVVADKDAFFSVDGDTVTATEDNPGNTERSAELIVRESSGKFTDKSVTVIQKAGVDYSLTSTKIPGAEIWNYGRGEEYSFSLTLTTNLPEERISVTVPEWINAALNEDKLTLTLEANASGNTRSALVEVKDSKRKAEGFSFTINQVSSIVTPEGMVLFDDPYFKAAVLEGFDLNADNQLSEEEALAINDLNVESKHVTSLTGTEAMHNIRSINISDNHISYADFSAFPNFCNLKTIKAIKMGEKFGAKIEVSGCYRGPSFSVEIGNEIVQNNKVGDEEYLSDDNYKPLLEKITEHTKGQGITLIFYIKGFCDIEYESGAAKEWVVKQTEWLFETEPFKTMSGYFDVYLSPQIYKKRENKTQGISYAVETNELIAELLRQRKAVIEVTLENKPQERSCAINPMVAFHVNSKESMEKPLNERKYINNLIKLYSRKDYSLRFTNRDKRTLAHEMGHALGGLYDQYEEEGISIGISDNHCWNEDKLTWEQFFGLPEYEGRVGIYTNSNGGYYPSPHSIMSNVDENDKSFFDSPSRWALFRNIYYTGGEIMTDKECWEAFLKYDKINDSLPY